MNRQLWARASVRERTRVASGVVSTSDRATHVLRSNSLIQTTLESCRPRSARLASRTKRICCVEESNGARERGLCLLDDMRSTSHDTRFEYSAAVYWVQDYRRHTHTHIHTYTHSDWSVHCIASCAETSTRALCACAADSGAAAGAQVAEEAGARPAPRGEHLRRGARAARAELRLHRRDGARGALCSLRSALDCPLLSARASSVVLCSGSYIVQAYWYCTTWHNRTRTCAVQVARALPLRLQGFAWQLVYSNDQHGFSLATLYRRLLTNEVHDRPLILAICDMEDHVCSRWWIRVALNDCHLWLSDQSVVLWTIASSTILLLVAQVFGAILSNGLHVEERYYGTGECSVFSFVNVPKSRRSRTPSSTSSQSSVASTQHPAHPVVVHQHQHPHQHPAQTHGELRTSDLKTEIFDSRSSDSSKSDEMPPPAPPTKNWTEFRLYRWSGENNFFTRCTISNISIGAGQ